MLSRTLTCFALLLFVGCVSTLNAQPAVTRPADPSTRTQKLGPHRGNLQTVGNLQVETLVSAAGLKVFVYDAGGKPLSVDRLRGVASLSVAGNVKRYRYDLFPAEDNSLKAAVNLSRVARRQVSIEYQLVGIRPGVVRFRGVSVVPSKAAKSEASVARGTEEVRPGVRKVTTADKPFIAAQKKCPVMDEPLDAMGGPYQVSADGKAIYICCPGCAKKVVAEPNKYLAVLKSQGIEPPTIK